MALKIGLVTTAESWRVSDSKIAGLGQHIAKVVDCQAADDGALVWSLELLWPLGPACGQRWAFVTGRTWQPVPSNRLRMLLGALGYEDPKAARRASPGDLRGRELVAEFGVELDPPTGEERLVIVAVKEYDREHWKAFTEWKRKGKGG